MSTSTQVTITATHYAELLSARALLSDLECSGVRDDPDWNDVVAQFQPVTERQAIARCPPLPADPKPELAPRAEIGHHTPPILGR